MVRDSTPGQVDYGCKSFKTTVTSSSVAYLEGQVTEISKSFDRLQGQIAALDERIDGRFSGLETRLLAFEDRVDARFEALDAKVSRLFTWLVGMFIMTMTAIVGTFLAR